MITYSALMRSMLFDHQLRHHGSDFIGLKCGTQVWGFLKNTQDDSFGQLKLRCIFLRKHEEYKAMIYFTYAHYWIVLEKLFIAYSYC